MMNIIPLSSSINRLGPVAGGGPNILDNQKTGGKTFADVFQEAVQNVEDLEAVKRQDSYNLAVGEVDDLAQIGINSSKADMAVTLMVQMRNKLLDSYSEIMRMNI